MRSTKRPRPSATSMPSAVGRLTCKTISLRRKKTPTKEDVLCRSCPTKEDVVDVFLGATCRPALGLCGAKSGQLWAIVGLCLANLVHVVGI